MGQKHKLWNPNSEADQSQNREPHRNFLTIAVGCQPHNFSQGRPHSSKTGQGSLHNLPLGAMLPDRLSKNYRSRITKHEFASQFIQTSASVFMLEFDGLVRSSGCGGFFDQVAAPCAFCRACVVPILSWAFSITSRCIRSFPLLTCTCGSAPGFRNTYSYAVATRRWFARHDASKQHTNTHHAFIYISLYTDMHTHRSQINRSLKLICIQHSHISIPRSVRTTDTETTLPLHSGTDTTFTPRALRGRRTLEPKLQ